MVNADCTQTSRVREIAHMLQDESLGYKALTGTISEEAVRMSVRRGETFAISFTPSANDRFGHQRERRFAFGTLAEVIARFTGDGRIRDSYRKGAAFADYQIVRADS